MRKPVRSAATTWWRWSEPGDHGLLHGRAPNSQTFPPGLRRFYPDTGNFIGFVGNVRSKALVERFHASFSKHSTFPAEKASLPATLPGIGWSDHWSFWQAGYPALMVTDTATFRYPHYHKASDTPDKLDFPRFTKVVQGVALAVKDLLNPGAEGGRKKRKKVK